MPSASIMLAPIPSNRLGPIRSASGFGPISGGLNLPPPGSLGISLPPSALAFLIKSLNLSMSPEGGLPLSAPGRLSCTSGVSVLNKVLEFIHIDRRASWTSARSSFYGSARITSPVGRTFFHRFTSLLRLMAIPDPLPSGGISPARNPGPLMPTGLAAPPICFLVTLPYKPELPLFFFIV
jgi:hypothetical protein